MHGLAEHGEDAEGNEVGERQKKEQSVRKGKISGLGCVPYIQHYGGGTSEERKDPRTYLFQVSKQPQNKIKTKTKTKTRK